MVSPVIFDGQSTALMNYTSQIESYVLQNTVGANAFSTPVLQPVWDFILENGQPYCAHWLFAGWLTFAGYLMACFYFTYKGEF